MKKTPFMYLKDNVDNIAFNCDEEYLLEYKKAFKAVLDKMDKYFIKNNLYEVVDYQPIVEKMLSSKEVFSFLVGETEKGVAGRFTYDRGKPGIMVIIVNPLYFHSEYFEGILCHEFIHYLTLGPKTITYIKEGDKYENHFPQYTESFSLGGKKINVTKGRVDGIDGNEELQGGFFCEVFTELLTEKIYEKMERITAYGSQVKFINFLNNLIGARENIEDFLRCELPNCIRVLGRKRFEDIWSYCKEYHEKFTLAKYNVYWPDDKDYKQAQDLVCEGVLKNVLDNIKRNPEEFSIKEYLRIVNCILTFAPTSTIDDNCFFGAIERYGEIIKESGDILIDNLKEDFLNKEKYRELLDKTIKKEFMHRKKYFTVPSRSDFVLKKGEDHLDISFKGEDFKKVEVQIDTPYYLGKYSMEVRRAIDNKSVYEIRVKELNKKEQEEQIIKVGYTKEGTLLVEDINNGRVSRINFDAAYRVIEREINENITLLDNFRYYDDIERFLKENASIEPYTIKKVKASNGEEYFVVNGKGNSAFYKIDDDGCREVKVKGKEKIGEGISVMKRYKTAMGGSEALVSYMNIGDKSDEDSLLFHLEDGSTFVRYFNNMGSEQIGQQADVFFNSGEKMIEYIDNKTIYKKGNKDIKELFSCKKEQVSRV